MAQYTVDEAEEELREMQSKLMPRVERYFSGKDAYSIARLLYALENEVASIEAEARKLRLKGELDLKVYKTLTHGYLQILANILEQSSKKGLEGDVRSYYTFLRLEASGKDQQR